jgi:hypothetical protein
LRTLTPEQDVSTAKIPIARGADFALAFSVEVADRGVGLVRAP